MFEYLLGVLLGSAFTGALGYGIAVLSNKFLNDKLCPAPILHALVGFFFGMLGLSIDCLYLIFKYIKLSK